MLERQREGIAKAKAEGRYRAGSRLPALVPPRSERCKRMGFVRLISPAG
jgi:hypothetical protein